MRKGGDGRWQQCQFQLPGQPAVRAAPRCLVGSAYRQPPRKVLLGAEQVEESAAVDVPAGGPRKGTRGPLKSSAYGTVG